MRCALIKIDLIRLTHRLRAAQGQWLSEWDLRQWLEGAGCSWSSGSWFVCHEDKQMIRDDEILERQTRETSDGVTFIENAPVRNPIPPAG
jgi:hypothetical protein